MGAWAAGPFDNDTAADWCGDLSDASPPQREQRIRVALSAAADETGYLDSDVAFEAIAAAAVVASQRPGGADLVQTAYAPDFLEAGGALALPSDLMDLGRRALDRVLGQNSEWQELWSEAGEAAGALEQLGRIRKLLAS